MAQGVEYRVEERGFDMKSIFPDAANADLYDNGKQTFNIGLKGEAPLAIYNFKIVEPESFGGGKLIGAEVDLFLNSINSGWIDIKATYNGGSITKRFTVSLSRAGAQG